MRRSFITVLIAALVILSVPLRADDLVLRLLGDYLDALRSQAAIPGMSAAIVGDNDIIWERAYGAQDLEKSIATRGDTPFHFDGLTQILTSTVMLQCVEQGKISLDDRVGQYVPKSTDANATLRQILTHTSGTPDNLTFAYHPERLAPLAQAVRACTDNSFRETSSTLLERLAMIDSVPGPDITTLVPPAEGIPTHDQIERYAPVLLRLAKPYQIDSKGRASSSQYLTTTLTSGGGLISTTHDFAKFDVALRKGILINASTFAASLKPPVARNGQPLPHAIGWFVQTYKGETVAWQYGVQENAASALVIKLPGRGLTLILLANSDGLIRPFALSAGDITISPFARVFLGLMIR